MQKIAAFRTLHLHGRILPALIDKTEMDLNHHTLIDGELIAGSLLGWNFGDGHLSGPDLLSALQARLNFSPKELRIISVESQPLFRQTQQWEIHDAATGLLDSGEIHVAALDNMPIGGQQERFRD